MAFHFVLFFSRDSNVYFPNVDTELRNGVVSYVNIIAYIGFFFYFIFFYLLCSKQLFLFVPKIELIRNINQKTTFDIYWL